MLNLPPIAPSRVRMEGSTPKVTDLCRQIAVKLTPEEWVRQHFVDYLHYQLGYPYSIIGNEVSLTLNRTWRRADTVIYDANGAPFIIVEYKAPSVGITQRVFDQIVRYNMVLRAPYLAVSNGLQHYFCAIDYDSGSFSYIPELPRHDNRRGAT